MGRYIVIKALGINFGNHAKRRLNTSRMLVMCDISDFYNQIYLHTIENQLIYCGFPNQVRKSIKEMIISVTQRSSKGIPIGPHCCHLIAEMSLIPFDDNLFLREIEFKRYVDDIIIFCNSEKEARIRLNQIAEVLDKEQRLYLQKQKTKILTSVDFVTICKQNLMEEISNEAEEEIMQVSMNIPMEMPIQKLNYQI